MTMSIATRTVSRNGSASTSAPASKPKERRPAGRRNTGRIALGLVVLVLSVLGAVTLFSSAADRTAVIGVARDVPPGAMVTEADLREVSISAGSGLRVVPASRSAEVVGRTASDGLTAGSLLNPDQLTDGPALPEGMVLVGAVLKGGQFPVGLTIGDSVEIIETTAPDAASAGEPVSRGIGTVTDLSNSTDGQSLRTVSIAVPGENAAAISAAGAAGRVSLVVTAP
jgi:hypothetical protein